MRFESAGHAAFAITMIVLGMQGVIEGDFAAIWQPVTKGVPARALLVYLCAFVILASGIGLLWQRAAAVASRVLFVFLLLWLLLFKVPGILRAPTAEVSYESCGETAVIVAGAWVLYAWFAGDSDTRRFGFAGGETGVRAARVVYSVALIAFGLSHFAYVNETAELVPGWLPSHLAWAYFTGCTYIAAGVALLVGVCARLAAALSALQIGMFTLLVWAPVVATGHANASQWSEFVVSWAMTAGAWVVADSYRGMPWLAAARHVRSQPVRSARTFRLPWT